MNKEVGNSNAPYFALPQGLNGVKPHAPIFYGSTPEKHPTNSAAKIVPQREVMNQVLHAK